MDAADRDAIADAIRRAESRTAGEIVVVVERAASRYRTVPVVTALGLALLIPWPLIWLTMASAQRIFLIQLVGALILLATLLWYGRGGRVVPRFVKRRRAHEAALREFVARGLTRTKDRTGVLLYVALQERYAQVVADTGIDGLVEPHSWDAIIEPLLVAAREDRLTEGLIAAVDAAGTLLARHVPPVPGEADELPNKVVLL